MGELIVAIALIVLSVLIYTQTDDLPSMNESQLDAGSFPQFVAIILGGLSLILAIKQTIVLVKARQQNNETSIKEQLLYIVKEHKLVFITLALLFLYILAIQILGFILSSIIFMIVTALVIGPRTKKEYRNSFQYCGNFDTQLIFLFPKRSSSQIPNRRFLLRGGSNNVRFTILRIR